MALLIQPSFAKGEISPTLYGRVDTAAYQVALAKARNCVIHPYGGVSNRPGTIFIGPCKDHTYAPRLIPFQFKTADQYILEFGNLYIRFIRNDAYVTETAITGVTATKANPCVMTKTSHGYATGDEIICSGFTEMVEVNGNRYKITRLNANTFSLESQIDGTTDVSSSGFGAAETTGGTVARIYQIVTTYLTADLDELKYTQSADTMTITHSSYPARDITRTDHNAWTIADISFTPRQVHPTFQRIKINSAASETRVYGVTSIRDDTFEESLTATACDTNVITGATQANPVVLTVSGNPFLNGDTIRIEEVVGMTQLNGNEYVVANKATNSVELSGVDGSGFSSYSSAGIALKKGWVVSAATRADPCVVTITGHNFSDGDEIEINDVVGMTELNGRRYIITSATTNTVTLLGVNSSGYTAYSSVGVANQTFIKITTSHETEDNTIGWITASDAARYAIYRRDQGIWGLIGEETGLAFTDDNFAPDTSITPPLFHDPLSLTNEYPGTSSYFEQRQVYGGSVNKPDTVQYSRTGDRTNMSAASPALASDAFSATMSSRQVNEIRHFVPLNDLLIFTSGAEWQVNSGPDTAFELASIRQKPQSFWGANHLRPITIGNVVFFTEESSASVRSLGYSFQLDGYTGTNINLLANHLLKDNTIEDWCGTRSPEARFYMVRNDGMGLTLTFDNEQEVIAWTTYDTDGKFKRFASLDHATGESQDQVYSVVQRTINSKTVYYVEKMADQMTSDDPADAKYLDSMLSLDSPLAITNVTAAKPVVVTSTMTGLADGDMVDIEGIIWEPTTDDLFTDVQPIQAIGRYKIAEVSGSNFEIATATNGKDISAITEAVDGSITTVFDHGFTVGDEVHFHDVGGMVELNGNGHAVKAVTNSKVFTIEQSTSGYTTFTSGGKVYKAIDGIGWNAYKSGGNVRESVTSVRGLDHLEGEIVVGNLNGNVIRAMTVTGGKITFPDSRAYSRAHIGMPYISEIETLDLEPPQGTVQGVKKKISNITVKFENSRGLVAGVVRGRTTETPSGLVEMKQREFERLGEPTRLLTGTKKLILKPAWKASGKILLRQKDPMPMNILAIVPDIEIGDTQDVQDRF
jgi:hypothetical protein